MASPTAADAFRLLQAGDIRGALEAVQRVLAIDPANARAHVAAGVALRMAGRLGEARAALARALALDPGDHAAAYEGGLVAQLSGDVEAALAGFRRSAELRPEFHPAHFAAGLAHADRREWSLAAAHFRRVLELRPGDREAQLQLALVFVREGRDDAAQAAFARALADHPADAAIARAYGQYAVSRGEYARAADLFAQAQRLQPGDSALPMYRAQCELLAARWTPGWSAYASREPRRQFERAAASRGTRYEPPAIAELKGRVVGIVGEQGLGDALFFLRWAPALKEAGARLRFCGDPRLQPLLRRTGLFEGFDDAHAPQGDRVVLAGDLPSLFPDRDPLCAASLRIDPLPDRISRWKATLDGWGPRPWIGVSWRSGTPPEGQPHALSKSVPVEPLFASLRGTTGTLVAVQRAIRPGEIEAASAAVRRPVHDASRANDELEDILALVALLDRHVAVSSTTIHLAAAAGASADVLVPFPPEWRWRAQGSSPWFPRFRVHRQGADGSWSDALSGAARGVQGIGLQ